jgi:type I restriction enzyme S subunit
MTLGPNAILIKFGDSNDFMYYFLTSPLGQHLVNSIKSGSANPKFNKTDFKKIKFLLPPLPEQQAIASVLSSFDDKIELLREENKTLEEIGKTIFKEWFGNYGLDDFVKAHEILEFEKGVEIGSKNYFENKNNLENPEMFYRVGDIANNGNNSSLYCEKDLLKNRIFKKDDVLVSFDGTIGRVFVGGNGGYSSGIRKVFDKNKKIKSSFLYFWAKSEQVQETISLYSEGTTIQHAGKSIPYLEIISNQENIDEITESLNSIFIKILDNLDQIQYLARSRDELLPKLTSGQIRVNNFNKN